MRGFAYLWIFFLSNNFSYLGLFFPFFLGFFFPIPTISFYWKFILTVYHIFKNISVCKTPPPIINSSSQHFIWYFVSFVLLLLADTFLRWRLKKNCSDAPWTLKLTKNTDNSDVMQWFCDCEVLYGLNNSHISLLMLNSILTHRLPFGDFCQI